MDQLFKELLQAFFPEFMQLFFAAEAARLDFGRGVTFREPELFTDVPEGAQRVVDLLAEVYTTNGVPELILVHIDVQKQRRGTFPYRMWEYYALLRLRTKLPVFPLAVYLSPGAGGLTNETYTETVLGRTPLTFQYAVVGLPDMQSDNWRNQANPLAPALSAVMKNSALGRVTQKFEALLAIARLNTDDARKALLANVVERFIVLQGSEATELRGRIEQISDAEEIKEMISVYEERGIEKGITIGLEQGLIQGQRRSVLRLLTARFGTLPDVVKARVETITDATALDALADRAATAATLDEVGLS